MCSLRLRDGFASKRAPMTARSAVPLQPVVGRGDTRARDGRATHSSPPAAQFPGLALNTHHPSCSSFTQPRSLRPCRPAYDTYAERVAQPPAPHAPRSAAHASAPGRLTVRHSHPALARLYAQRLYFTRTHTTLHCSTCALGVESGRKVTRARTPAHVVMEDQRGSYRSNGGGGAAGSHAPQSPQEEHQQRSHHSPTASRAAYAPGYVTASPAGSNGGGVAATRGYYHPSGADDEAAGPSRYAAPYASRAEASDEARYRQQQQQQQLELEQMRRYEGEAAGRQAWQQEEEWRRREWNARRAAEEEAAAVARAEEQRWAAQRAVSRRLSFTSTASHPDDLAFYTERGWRCTCVVPAPFLPLALARGARSDATCSEALVRSCVSDGACQLGGSAEQAIDEHLFPARWIGSAKPVSSCA